MEIRKGSSGSCLNGTTGNSRLHDGHLLQVSRTYLGTSTMYTHSDAKGDRRIVLDHSMLPQIVTVGNMRVVQENELL